MVCSAHLQEAGGRDCMWAWWCICMWLAIWQCDHTWCTCSHYRFNVGTSIVEICVYFPTLCGDLGFAGLVYECEGWRGSVLRWFVAWTQIYGCCYLTRVTWLPRHIREYTVQKPYVYLSAAWIPLPLCLSRQQMCSDVYLSHSYTNMWAHSYLYNSAFVHSCIDRCG